jgi:hypothetical protein
MCLVVVILMLVERLAECYYFLFAWQIAYMSNPLVKFFLLIYD